ncbi:4-hydroxy-tetrahydrodipicolinate reductase [Faecalimonas sp.]
MVNIILHGCNGKMGRFVTVLAKEDEEVEIVAGIDQRGGEEKNYPIFRSLKECKVKADVVIDFSDASGVNELVEFCEESSIPLVLCTTGLSEIQQRKVEKFAEKVPVLQSANMSIGITVLCELLKGLGEKSIFQEYDVELIEKHHRYKKDAPSGTALLLKKAMGKEEIPIVSIRGGTIVGEHQVSFAGQDEVIEIKHTAYSRAVFARGALKAAKFLMEQKAGLYTMKNMIV